MLRFAISVVGSIAWTTLSLAGPIGVSSTHPQGQERSPTEREFFAPVPTPANFAEVAGPTGSGKRIDFDNMMQHFQRSLGIAKGMLVMRGDTFPNVSDVKMVSDTLENVSPQKPKTKSGDTFLNVSDVGMVSDTSRR